MYKRFHLYDTKFLTRLPSGSAGVYIEQLTLYYSQLRKNEKSASRQNISEGLLKWQPAQMTEI